MNKRMTTRLLPALLAASTLAACVTAPPPPPPPPPVAAVPPVDTHVYAYPRNGQSDEQLDRDRYECHLWAVQQSGFDPSGPNVPPQQRVVVVREGPNQGATTAAGAFTGAIIGAAVSNPRNAGVGAIIGAIAGGALGAAAGSQPPQTTTIYQNNPAYRDMERQAASYRRAVMACLDGRGYTVR